jgi:hypothetical protein
MEEEDNDKEGGREGVRDEEREVARKDRLKEYMIHVTRQFMSRLCRSL